MWVGTLVNRLGGFVVPLLTFYLTGERGFTIGEAGALVSLFGAGQAAAGLVGGALADRIGRRPTMLASLWGGAAAMVGLGLASSIPAIAVLTLTLGFVGELYRPAVSAVVADVVPAADRLRAYGLLYWAVNLGFAIAPVVGGLIATRSYFALFIGDAVTMALYGVIVALRVPETRPARAPGHAARATRAADLVRDRVFLLFALATFFAAVIPWQSGVALSAHMAAQGHSEAVYGAVLATNGLVIVLVQPLLTRRLGGFEPQRVLAAAALVSGVGIALHGAVAAVPLHVAAVLIWTLAELAWSPVASAMVANLAPEDARGRYQGAITTAWGLASFGGPLVGAQVLGALGAGPLFGGCLGLGALVGIFLLVTAPARRARLRRVA